jgi:hypothetical protein
MNRKEGNVLIFDEPCKPVIMQEKQELVVEEIPGVIELEEEDLEINNNEEEDVI